MTDTTQSSGGWRVVDIVVAAVIAVAFGVVFLAWNAIYTATEPVFAFLPPAQAVLYGIWLLPAVLVGLIVRRPGAAFFGGFVAAAVSVLLGSPYGADALVSGAIQGAGAELGFAIGLYRRWNLPVRQPCRRPIAAFCVAVDEGVIARRHHLHRRDGGSGRAE